jgi:hypothetical protein
MDKQLTKPEQDRYRREAAVAMIEAVVRVGLEMPVKPPVGLTIAAVAEALAYFAASNLKAERIDGLAQLVGKLIVHRAHTMLATADAAMRERPQ